MRSYCTCASQPLVLLQRHKHLLDAVLGDDEHLEGIAHLNVALRRAVKRVLDNRLDLRPGEGLAGPLLEVVAGAAPGNVLVVKVDLVVEKGHDEARRGAAGAALLALVAADGVVRVDGADALLVEAAEQRVRVVREEALLVENRRQALGARVERHGLAVAVAVDLADGVEAVAEGLAVGREAAHGKHNRGVVLRGVGAANLEHLGGHARVDAVAARVSCVARHDGEVGAGDAEGRAAVVSVSEREKGVSEGYTRGMDAALRQSLTG